MSWNSIWEDVFREKDWGKYPSEDLIRFIAQRFYRAPERGQVRILELGCGPGGNLWYLAREGLAAYGMDGSPTALEKARRRLELEVPGWTGELVQGDIQAIPLPDEYFDAVLDVEAVCCNPYDAAQGIYAEAARVTKPGGWLFSRTFASGCWGDRTGEKLGHNAWRVAEGPLAGLGYTRFTDRQGIDDLMRGFKVQSVEYLWRSLDQGAQVIKEWMVIARKEA